MASVTVISIGAMGLGIAKVLQTQGHKVLTSLQGRSEATRRRAQSANITPLENDATVISQSDYVLSILPPADALSTAQRLVSAYASDPSLRAGKSHPLYYLDLNAISPHTARSIASIFNKEAPDIVFIDGGIIGNPPTPPADGSLVDANVWKRPSIPLSGPPLTSAPVHGDSLAMALNTTYLGDAIGTASTLKLTFATLTKGFTALALQSYTTASRAGVLPELQRHLDDYVPGVRDRAERGIVGCTSKAGRWVGEMEEIGKAHAEEGGWGDRARVFGEIARVFEGVSEVDGAGGLKSAEEVAVALGQVLKE
ncbi:6-phosphogluconate dehydrogenase C-terminal domain-like protein [Pseudovirgaria hyperparasitica]|uniref:6-phosphogluconate dehydrogenase C-terminal domain-like protein n=1 Tax=Pseudovirgaria hyperparasitica TaxID=470096 RepID=A0A6A6W0E4_9PEZI|nr:6-phosphogluconate dehydrogenase C-terminal domain-like protein [Pseudovirgaria hyperparasitica]KAF2756388.1 6-phosphogluconate dehydrogenase C-terminal domain-like protein [Pseudovirgaria hyperparasitica]